MSDESRWIDDLGNEVFPLMGRVNKGASGDPIPVWKRKVKVEARIRSMGRFMGYGPQGVRRDSELAYELTDPPGHEGWRDPNVPVPLHQAVARRAP